MPGEAARSAYFPRHMENGGRFGSLSLRRGGWPVPITITFHPWIFTVTIRIDLDRRKNRHSDK